MNEVEKEWSLFFDTDQKINIRLPQKESFVLKKVEFMKAGAWRFYVPEGYMPQRYILAVLSDDVRCEIHPNYIIKSPSQINGFLKTYGIKVENI